MYAQSVMFDFNVDPKLIQSQESCNHLLSQIQGILKEKGLGKSSEVNFGDGLGSFVTLIGPDQSVATLRAYPTGLITLTLEYFIPESGKPVFSSEELQNLQDDIKKLLSTSNSKLFHPIRRGDPIDQYYITSDERLLEYDFDKVLFDGTSDFQRVEIKHSVTFGNVLILDSLQNLAESDLVYTETLMNRGNEDYCGKDILILGGGDGALLYELLKEKPNFVTMVDIDEMVMDSCRKYMRSVCGDCLDTYKTDKYHIIVDDALKIMDEYIKEGRSFDYVFGDLTDIPISPRPEGTLWEFIRKILKLSFQLLAPKGKFLTHGNGAGSGPALAMYEQQLEALELQFSRAEAFVPSFLEKWVFYRVWKNEE